MFANAPGIFLGKRLVVFGAGYVGGAVAREAVRLGLRVTALTRNSGTARSLATDGIEVVTAELASDEWHAQIPGGADFALNCVSSGGSGTEAYRRSYVDGMKSVLAWAKSSGAVGTLLYTSSTSVYPQSGGARVDEQASIEGARDTAQVLLEAENLLRAAPAEIAHRWFILRLAGIYGPGRHHLLDQLRNGETEFRGRGDHRLNLVHRDDIVAGILAAFAAPREKIANEIFNLADDGAATKAEVVGWLAEQLGCRTPSFTGAPMNERRSVPLDRVISSDKIKAILGWRPRYPDFRAGYRAILEA